MGNTPPINLPIDKVPTATRRQLIKAYKETYADLGNYYYDCVYNYLGAIEDKLKETGGYPKRFWTNGVFNPLQSEYIKRKYGRKN